MNVYTRRLNAVAAQLPFAATLDPASRAVIADTARRYGLDADELAEEVEQTIIELAAASVTDPAAQVRYICQRDGLDEDAVFAELYGHGRRHG